MKSKLKNSLKNLNSQSRENSSELNKFNYKNSNESYNIKVSIIDNLQKDISRHPSDINLITKGSSKKVVIYGEKETGKTTFVLKICENKFEKYYIPSFCDESFDKNILFKNLNKKYLINFIISNNINKIIDADFYFIIFDLTSFISYNKAKKLILEQISHLNKPIFFFGNKCDLKNKFENNDLKSFCQKVKCEYFEISLKESIGISSFLNKFGENLNL